MIKKEVNLQLAGGFAPTRIRSISATILTYLIQDSKSEAINVDTTFIIKNRWKI